MTFFSAVLNEAEMLYFIQEASFQWIYILSLPLFLGYITIIDGVQVIN